MPEAYSPATKCQVKGALVRRQAGERINVTFAGELGSQLSIAAEKRRVRPSSMGWVLGAIGSNKLQHRLPVGSG